MAQATLTSTFSDIADAIRTKTGKVATMTPAEMPGEILSIGSQPKVYGAVWDGSSNTAWTRTDDAVGFSDPEPYYSGMSGTPSSPFDTIEPWSGMVVSDDANAGKVVAIPKFYYKMGYASGTTGLKIQIAPASNGDTWATANGFKVSPAHMDRGDGVGERDVVYVSRYPIASDYKSKTGVVPAQLTRSAARTGVHALNSHCYVADLQLLYTIRMLYLVEFADWNSQAKIGYGCGPSSANAFYNTGATDSMTYHTGTNQTSITSYGVTQYRWLESLWDNNKWSLDGCVWYQSNLYGFTNPETYSNTYSDGIVLTDYTGIASGSYIIGDQSSIKICTVPGFEWFFYPTAFNGSNSTYIPDLALVYNQNYSSSFVTGGRYIEKDQDAGLMFFQALSADISTRTNEYQRLQIL